LAVFEFICEEFNDILNVQVLEKSER